ncbi:MAG: hypothetical protein ABI699_00145 [Caldimonas sp.]
MIEASSGKMPTTSVIADSCQAARRSCWLYAVDNEVVWQADAGQRIGSKQALGTLPTAKP